MRRKQKKYAGQLPDIGYQLIVCYIKDLLTGLTYSVYTLARLKNSWPSYMKECAIVMWGDVH